MATDKNRGLDLSGIESLEPMILMSASAADINAATLDDATEGNDVMVALEAGGFMDGKAGNDVLIGLAGDNYLKGGDGHDMLIAIRGDNVIDGGDGQDTLVYWGGNRADYKVTDKGFGILEIDNGRSTDFVTNVEEIQFRDGSYSVADLFNAGSAPAAPAALVVDAVAPVDAEEVVTEPAVPVAVEAAIVEEAVEVTTTQLTVEEVVVDEIAVEETDEVVVVDEVVTDEEAEEVVVADEEVVVVDEIAVEETDEVVVVDEGLTDEEAEEIVVVEEEVVVDEIVEEETDEIVVVEEEIDEEATEEGDPVVTNDDDVWACVDHWMSNCTPGCDLEVPPVDEDEVIVVEEPVDCVVGPPVEEPPVCEPPVVCEEVPPVVNDYNEECHDDYNWCYTTPSYSDCNLLGWIEPVLTNCFSIFDQVCDQNYSNDTCHNSGSSYSYTSSNDCGWSWGGWSKWFGCW